MACRWRPPPRLRGLTLLAVSFSARISMNARQVAVRHESATPPPGGWLSARPVPGALARNQRPGVAVAHAEAEGARTQGRLSQVKPRDRSTSPAGWTARARAWPHGRYCRIRSIPCLTGER